MSTDEVLEAREISTPRVGRFKVYLQGNFKHCQFVVMTVHDLGCNHNQWNNFLRHDSMYEVVKRAAFIHIDVPGQEHEAKDLPPDYTFPTMQNLGEDLVCVLDQLDVKQVVGIGEGAGANILVRFAMAQPTRVLGICLIHCTGTTAGFMESIKDKVIAWKLDHVGMNPTAEQYFCLHRFGSFDKATDHCETKKIIETFQDSLRSKINPHNLKRFVTSFMKRTNVADNVGSLKCQVLSVTGSKASFNHTVHTLHGHMTHQLKKNQCEILEVDGVANVIEERPQKLAESFVYFCQGIGVLGGVPMMKAQSCHSPTPAESDDKEPPMGRLRKQRSMSMEEYDKPLGIYSSSPGKYGSSPPSYSTSPSRTSQLAAHEPKVEEQPNEEQEQQEQMD